MNTKSILAYGLACLLAMPIFAAGLPAGYQQIPYIQADGKSAYVLTDYTPNPSTDKIVAEVSFPETPAQNMCIWCARNNSTAGSSPSFTVFLLSGTGGYNFRADYGKKYVSKNTANIAAAPTPVYTLTFDRNVFSWSGEDGKTYEFPADSSFTDASFSSSCGKMMLFASYNGNLTANGNWGKHRLHSLKVYRNGALLYDIVPVRDNNKALKLCNKTDNSISLPLSGTFTGDPWKSFLERLTTSENVIPAAEAEAATGGDIIWKIGSDYMHIFTNANASATFTPVVKDLTARILMVAGGGGGGGSAGGGGGAGGMIDTNGVVLAVGTPYTVTVGKGGDSVLDGIGKDGSNTTVSAIADIAKGGGGGGCYTNGGRPGGSGGGGGASSGNVGTPSTAGGDGTVGQGSAGGAGGGGFSRTNGGGGGGADAVGAVGSSSAVGHGGAGRTSDILGYQEPFAGGGGGGVKEGVAKSSGGAGGGGTGGTATTTKSATAGQDGLGGGGGGGSGGWTSAGVCKESGAGGSGIVIIRYHYTAAGEKEKVNVPLAISGLVYDGTEQRGVNDDIHGSYTLSGHLATVAGEHVATATLTDTEKSEWADDGSTAPRQIPWSIAQAQNEWTTQAALSKTSWMVAEDTPGVLTVPVAKFGTVVATLNGESWDGETLPTTIGNYTAVWSVTETTDFTGLSVTKTFDILPVPSPENRNARYFDGTEWKGANSLAEAVAAAPDGGIVELNRDETSSTTITVNKSLTIRSCSARDVRYTLQLTASVTLLDFNGAGASSVLSNLVANVKSGVSFNTALISLSNGSLMLGRDLLLQKGSYSMGSLMTVANNVGPLTLDGVTVSDSVVQWGLFRIGDGVTVNLYDCNIQGITKGTSTQSNATALNLPGSQSVLNVYGGTITNNSVSAATYGQVYCAGTVNFCGGKPIIEDLGVPNATRINLKGDLDKDASVGVIYGAAEGDPFGTYESGDRAGARAFYPTWSDDPKLRGAVRGTRLVWKHPKGLILVFR